MVDVWAVNQDHWRLIQVKSGKARMTKAERAAFQALAVPVGTIKEIWSFAKRTLRVEVI